MTLRGTIVVITIVILAGAIVAGLIFLARNHQPV
jgi:hypothetical protein